MCTATATPPRKIGEGGREGGGYIHVFDHRVLFVPRNLPNFYRKKVAAQFQIKGRKMIGGHTR